MSAELLACRKKQNGLLPLPVQDLEVLFYNSGRPVIDFMRLYIVYETLNGETLRIREERRGVVIKDTHKCLIDYVAYDSRQSAQMSFSTSMVIRTYPI